MKRWAFLAAAVLVLTGCGGEGNKAVAHVGGQSITRKQLESVVEHFREEAKVEGKPFPDEGSAAFRTTRNRLLGLLVYRTELRAGAERLGVKVSPEQISRRMGAADAEAKGMVEANTFARDSVEAQLLIEGIFKRVTRGVTAPTQAELSARRNEAMARYLARLKRETKVRYEPGYEPGS